MADHTELLTRLLDDNDLGKEISDRAKTIIKREMRTAQIVKTTSPKSFAIENELLSLRAEVFALREKNTVAATQTKDLSFSAEQYSCIVRDICSLPQMQEPQIAESITEVLQKYITNIDARTELKAVNE